MLVLIGWQVQTGLYQRMIKYRVVFAAHHEAEASQIRKHGSRAILSIKAQQDLLLRELVGSQVATDSQQGRAQFREGCAHCQGFQVSRAIGNGGPD
jgi:hypothetical protein